MADIARLAGVSTSTVSRALKGSTLVNDETRERIAQIASQFNYTVNQLAMNLRSGTNRTIAVVVPYEKDRRQNFSDPFLHGMIGALADVLTERDYDMLLVRSSPSASARRWPHSTSNWATAGTCTSAARSASPATRSTPANRSG